MREHYPETVLSFVEKDIEVYAEIVLPVGRLAKKETQSFRKKLLRFSSTL